MAELAAIALTPTERRILECLQSTPGRPVTFATLTRAAFEYENDFRLGSVLFTHIWAMRKKGIVIETVRDNGYCLAIDRPKREPQPEPVSELVLVEVRKPCACDTCRTQPAVQRESTYTDYAPGSRLLTFGEVAEMTERILGRRKEAAV